MSQSDNNEEKLERLIARALRAQPARRAPQDLSARVFAELERRAARPWWRNTFAHWPMVARAGFLVASYGFVRLAIATAMWVTGTLRSLQMAGALESARHWLHGPANIMSVAADVGTAVVRTVPTYWLYGGAATALALYAVLFGLGATAYRTLYVNR